MADLQGHAGMKKSGDMNHMILDQVRILYLHA